MTISYEVWAADLKRTIERQTYGFSSMGHPPLSVTDRDLEFAFQLMSLVPWGFDQHLNITFRDAILAYKLGEWKAKYTPCLKLGHIYKELELSDQQGWQILQAHSEPEWLVDANIEEARILMQATTAAQRKNIELRNDIKGWLRAKNAIKKERIHRYARWQRQYEKLSPSQQVGWNQVEKSVSLQHYLGERDQVISAAGEVFQMFGPRSIGLVAEPSKLLSDIIEQYHAAYSTWQQFDANMRERWEYLAESLGSLVSIDSTSPTDYWAQTYGKGALMLAKVSQEDTLDILEARKRATEFNYRGFFEAHLAKNIERGTAGEWARHILESIEDTLTGGANYREVSA